MSGRIGAISRAWSPSSELHRDAVGDAGLDELAHDDGLGLGLVVDQAATGPQAEVGTELLGQALELVAGGHREVQLGALASGVEPDVAEVSAGGSRGEPVGLEQDDLRAPPGEVVRRRGPDDPAADDQHIRRRRQGALLVRNLRTPDATSRGDGAVWR